MQIFEKAKESESKSFSPSRSISRPQSVRRSRASALCSSRGRNNDTSTPCTGAANMNPNGNTAPSADSSSSKVFLYFGWITLLIYLVLPHGYFLDITTTYMLKDCDRRRPAQP
jgi:hypothetical protein